MLKTIYYYAVIVLYNKILSSSASLSSLLNLSEYQISIIVLDNSVNENAIKNRELAYNFNIDYYGMNGNLGLSKAYNFALDLLKEKNGNDIVIWFDDDTPVTLEYFQVLNQAAHNLNYQVFAPIIRGEDGIIYSPNKTGIFKGKYIKSENQKINKDRFNAINSCLAVRLSAYRNYRYDERLFMDCVDTKLFDDFRLRDINFYVLPVIIYQNFFQRGNSITSDKLWFRFKNRIKDTAIYSGDNIKKNIISLIRIYGWGVIFGIKVKSLSFTIRCIYLGTSLVISNIARNLFRKNEGCVKYIENKKE